MLQITLESIFFFSAVFIFGALSGYMAERAGVVNIGIEGMMIIGAITFSIFGLYTRETTSNNMQFFAVLISGFAAMVFSVLYAWAAIKFKSQQIVSGVAINMVATAIGLFLVKLPSLTPNGSGAGIPSNYRAITFGGDAALNWYFLIGVILVLVIYLWIKFTKSGLRYSSVGDNPNASDSAGINVIKTRYVAVLISGFLAGIAGAIYVNATSYSFNGGVQGFGFISIAILIFGQWKPLFVGAASIIFGTLRGLAFTRAIAGVPSEILNMTPFLISLGILVATSKFSKVPKASGIPFNKSQR
ncbi:ABC transporter permease [Spiroplasma endosymbiont of Anurida maritima]|uniref:ABC transporter permease n=1 Tax=Spiroplasma endosymbiont of Anurida maritima TaxID=2967972 RepID=UPI0036D3AC7A